MHPVVVKEILESDAALCEFEPGRDYLGISAIYQCLRKLGRQMVAGRETPNLPGKRMFHEGYLHERDVIARLQAGGVEVRNGGREVVSPDDPRFRGHIDGEIDGELLEIKSVTTEKFEAVAGNGAFNEHMGQARLYMRFGGYTRGVIVYKDRQFGTLWVTPVRPDGDHERWLIERAQQILAAVDAGAVADLPCECGKCR